MKKLILASSATLFSLAAATGALAQDSDGPETPETEDVEDAGNGAIVTREELVEQVTDEDGNPVPIFNEDGTQATDEDGNLLFETVSVGFVQTVETPSGNVHTITKEDGSRAIVTHEFANKPERVARAEKPEKPERPEKPEKPERPEKPEKPERPEKPARPGA